MNSYERLRQKIKSEGLVPNSRKPGEFMQARKDKEHDGIAHLFPENWVYHPEIVEPVLEGKYDELKPVCSEFVATLNCSNRCGMCGYRFAKMFEGCWTKNNFKDGDVQMPSYEHARATLDRMIDFRIKGIIFTGGGEPFMFPRLEDLVAHVTSRGVDAVCYTNGNILTEKRVERLTEASPLLARVSLNAGTERVYNKFHNPQNPGAFARAKRTVEALARGSLRNPKMSVGVGVVVNEINRHDLNEVALRLREIVERTGGGIEFVTYRPSFNYYEAGQLAPELLDETSAIIDSDVRKTLEGTGIRVSSVTQRCEALKHDTRTYSECRASGFLAEVTPSGMYLCCDRNLNRKYMLGNQDKETIRNIHFGERRAELLKYLKGNKCSVCPPACKSHETNNQFQTIENLRTRGEMYKVKVWLEEMQKLPLPKMVNFP